MSGASLEGQFALVTGASRGIGREIALELARAGSGVIVNCRSRLAEAEGVVEQIRAAGGQAEAFAADASSEADVRSMVQFALRENKLKLIINLPAVKQADLKLSSKLLRMAEILE